MTRTRGGSRPLLLLLLLRAAAALPPSHGATTAAANAPALLLSLFHRRGVPYNLADWSGSALATVQHACNTSQIASDLSSRLPDSEGLCPYLFETALGNALEHGPNIFDFEQSRLHLKVRLLNRHRRAEDDIVALRDHPTATPGIADDPAARGNFFFQSPSALTHGAEQIEYLVSRGLLPFDFKRIAAGYRASLGLLSDQAESGGEALVFVPTLAMANLQHFLHNTLVYLPPPLPLVAAAARQSSSVFRASIDWNVVQERFLSGEIVVIDDVLSDWALDASYKFCLEATVFFEHRTGCVGAYLTDGLYSEVFERIAKALREKMPMVILDEDKLLNFWAYKYHNTAVRGERQSLSGRQGIGMHADKAKVSVNLWITPDEANMDPSSGGLDVWKGVPVRSEDEFSALQKCNGDECGGEITLRDRGGTKIRVPYRCNRMVLFDGSLVHATSPMRFRVGYANRRINLTWLFGRPSWLQERR